MSQDVLNGLEAIRSSLRQRLQANADFRALLSIERTIVEIAELTERPEMDTHHVAQTLASVSEPAGFIPAPEPPSSASAAVLESIAAKAVNSVAARSLSAFASAPRVAQARR